jgi:hypothetical protein
VLALCAIGAAWGTSGCAVHRLEVAGVAGRLRAGDESNAGEVDRAMMVDQASREFSCNPVNVGVRDTPGDPNVHIVDGCGLRAVYVTLHVLGVAYDAPEHSGRPVDVRATPVVKLAGEPRVALISATGFYAHIRMRQQDFEVAQEGLKALDHYFALQAAGARDLTCIQEQVVPMFERAGGGGEDAPRRPVAEGCGKRATYATAADGGYRLLAVDSITVGAAPLTHL